MINEKISGKQFKYIIIPFIFGSSIATGGSLIPEKDAWISMLLGIALSIPVVLIYANLHRLEPNKTLFDLAFMVLGRIGGAIVTFLFSVYALLLGALVIKNFTEYIHVVSLPETSQFLVAICFGLVIFYSVSKGLEITGRGCVFVLPISLFVIACLIFLSAPEMHIDHLKPILYNNTGKVLQGALSVVVFPFAETVLFTAVYSAVESKSNPAKLYIIPIVFAGLVLVLIKLSNTLVLGDTLVDSLYFPTYERAGVIEAGKFFSRVEILVSGNFILFALVKTTICLYVGCRGFAHLFKIQNHKKLALPLAAIMTVASSLVYKSTMQMFGGLSLYLIYAPFFEILIPIVILILLIIKHRKQKKIQSLS